jgi:hypothetical protein
MLLTTPCRCFDFRCKRLADLGWVIFSLSPFTGHVGLILRDKKAIEVLLKWYFYLIRE